MFASRQMLCRVNPQVCANTSLEFLELTSEKVLSSLPCQGGPFCVEYSFSLGLCRFPPGALVSSHRPKT